MKQIGPTKKVTAANAWGRDSTCTHTPYRVEVCDVTRVRENYRGHRRDHHQFRWSDVGREIDVMADGTGWTFTTNELTPPTRMTCCCCGKPAYGRQWRNRDKGFTLGTCCVEFASRGETPESMWESYGAAGTHYDLGEEK